MRTKMKTVSEKPRRQISERKQVEQALQAEKNKLQSVVDAMEYGLTIQDKDYNIIYQNEPLRIIFGDHLGEKCYRVYESRGNLCDGCPVEKAFRDGKSHNSERRVIIPSGEVTFWENTASPIRDAQGKITSCLEITRNITERKQVEQALQAEKNKLQSLVDAMEYALNIQDREHSILYLKEPAGMSSGGRVGDKCYRAFEGQDKACDGCPVEKAFRDGKSHTLERKVVRPSGEVIFWENTANPISDASGKITSCLELNRNITERKRAEEALRESEEKYKTLFESTIDGLCVIDAKTMKILLVNGTAARLYGFDSPEEAVGRNLIDFIAPEERQKAIGVVVKDLFQKDLHEVHEWRTIAKDGKEIWVSAVGARMQFQGRLAGLISFRDCTERKEAEEALRESEERFRSIVESSHAGIMILDDAYHLTYVNDELCRISGYSREEAIGQDFRQFLDEESRQIVVDRYLRRQRGEEVPSRYEFNMICKDGQKRRVEIISNVIRDSAGEVKTVAQVLDITEHKQDEEALRQSQEKLRQMFESVTDGISVVDLHGIITEVNQSMVDMHGFTSRDELLGKRALELVAPGDRERVAANMRKALKRGTVRGAEYTLLKADGTEFPGELSTSVLKDASGRWVGHITVVRDITERKQAEEELRLRVQMLDGATDSIFVHDLDENFVYVNEAACRTHGYSREEFLRMKLRRIVVPEKIGSLPALRQETLGKGEATFETAHLRKDGSIIPIEAHSRTIESGGRKLILAVMRDITARKKAEAEEKRLQQELYLSRRLAAIGELAAGVAHEINNPLTGVLGFSQRLLRKSTSEALSRDLEIIHDEAQRAANIVQNLLTFARRRQPKKEYSDINDILQKALELRSYALQTGNIEVATNLAPSLPKIRVDFPQTQEVFLNIILNAEQAMNEAHGGGKLIIKTRQIKDYVRISFADDGPGISPERLDKVFDPFFTTREGKGGTGLGLSVCHGIVTGHGGKIYARSKPGRGGTTFFVELPLTPAETPVGRRV